MEKATFAAGCFWGVEEAFRRQPGVLKTRVGYTGGVKENPSYEDVCRRNTGHAEAVEVVYDPDQISYEGLLTLFFQIHDPTQLNRQGPDVGTQYRSAIFYHDAEQEKAARAAKAAEQQKRGDAKVVTEIAPAATFWEAEEYHQQYFAKRGVPGCVL